MKYEKEEEKHEYFNCKRCDHVLDTFADQISRKLTILDLQNLKVYKQAIIILDNNSVTLKVGKASRIYIYIYIPHTHIYVCTCISIYVLREGDDIQNQRRHPT